jgi:hypothetical protein
MWFIMKWGEQYILEGRDEDYGIKIILTVFMSVKRDWT